MNEEVLTEWVIIRLTTSNVDYLTLKLEMFLVNKEK